MPRVVDAAATSPAVAPRDRAGDQAHRRCRSHAALARKVLALKAEGWKVQTSRSTGRKYYYNERTDESTYTLPEPSVPATPPRARAPEEAAPPEEAEDAGAFAWRNEQWGDVAVLPGTVTGAKTPDGKDTGKGWLQFCAAVSLSLRFLDSRFYILKSSMFGY